MRSELRGRLSRPARVWLAAPLLGAALLTSGCENDQPPDTVKKVVELRDLPENVREAAKKALPGVALEDAWKNLDNRTKALHSYEVRGRARNGKIREVRVATDGKILEME